MKGDPSGHRLRTRTEGDNDRARQAHESADGVPALRWLWLREVVSSAAPKQWQTLLGHALQVQNVGSDASLRERFLRPLREMVARAFER